MTRVLTVKGELRHISKLNYWPVSSVLGEKYAFSKEEAESIANFMGPMLQILPERRATAQQMLMHPWLQDR